MQLLSKENSELLQREIVYVSRTGDQPYIAAPVKKKRGRKPKNHEAQKRQQTEAACRDLINFRVSTEADGNNPLTRPKEKESGAMLAKVNEQDNTIFQTVPRKECSAFSTAMQKIGL